MEIRRLLKKVTRSVWFFLIALVSILVAGAVGRAVGDTAGIVLGVVVCLVMLFVLSIVSLIVAAWWSARSERLERSRPG